MTFQEISDLIDEGPQTLQCGRHENVEINGKVVSFGPNINFDLTKHSDRIVADLTGTLPELMGPPHATLEKVEYMSDGTWYATGRGGPFGLITRRKQITFSIAEE